MTTALELIGQLRAAAGDMSGRDQLASGIVLSDTTFVFASGESVSPRQNLSVGLEVVFVMDKPTTNNASVVRAYEGTTAVDHLIETPVYHSYRHSGADYCNALNRALESIGLAIGKPTWDTTQSFGSNRMLTVPATATRPFAVWSQSTGDPGPLRVPWKWHSSMPPALASTGKAVELIGWMPTSGTAYIGYETPWPPLATEAQVLDTEFPPEARHLLVQGGMAYLADPEMFERAAFHAPHVDVRSGTAEPDSVRLIHNTLLQRYLQERNELAAILGNRRSMAWIKGG